MDKNVRGRAYNKALKVLDETGHVLAGWGHTVVRKGIEYDVMDNYVLDTYGNRFMATHFPEFCAYNFIEPFKDAQEEAEVKAKYEIKIGEVF
jgi:hypothetical protein